MSESPPERLLLLFNFSSFCVYTQTILAARGQNLQQEHAAPALISSLPCFLRSFRPPNTAIRTTRADMWLATFYIPPVSESCQSFAQLPYFELLDYAVTMVILS